MLLRFFFRNLEETSQSVLMKLKNIILTLSLLVCTQFAFVQTIMITDIQGLDFGSNPGFAEVQLIFISDPVEWTATIDGDWLTMEPLSGIGTTTLFVEYAENLGPRRTARIIIETPGGEAEAITIEIRQFQNMPTIMMPVEFSILEFTHTDPMLLPYTARASFSYTPIDTMLFFSLLARVDDTSEPAWVLQNIPMPESYWHDSTQEISARFDLGLLGFVHGQSIEHLQYSYTLSYEPDTIMPVAPEYSYLDAPVQYSIIDAFGRLIEDILVPDTIWTYFTPDWARPFEVTNKYYVGCEMVNGDLDSSKYALEKNGCGPAAATNSLKWLMKKHQDDINWPPEWHEGFKELAALMEQKGNGVKDGNFIRGKLDIIEAYNLPIKVKYQDNGYQGDVKSTSGNSSAKCHDATNTSYPTKEWMMGELKDKEDVEVGFTYPSGKGHWVVLTGTHSVSGRPGIFYKHDGKQKKTEAKEVKQEHSWIKEEDGKMKLSNEGNAVIDIVVSESFDPDYQPEPSSESFNKYCQSIKRTIAPGRSISLTFPENDKRCYNTTVRVLDRHVSNSYKKEATWNFNSGKTRKYKNNSGKVVTVEFHNDDKYDGGIPLFKTYDPYIVNIDEIVNDIDGITDPGNPDEYAGFSVGTDDESYEEFGNPAGPEAMYVDSVGSLLHDFPKKFSSDGVRKITLQTEVESLNRYWNKLGLVLGIDSIATPGPMTISCPSTGYSETYEFVDAGEFEFVLGGLSEPGTFELVLELSGEGCYYFDNIGIPSLIQVEPIIELSSTNIEFDSAYAESQTIDVFNIGGSEMIWFITNEADWISIDPLSGINETTVTISCEENTSPDPRTSELTVTAYNARNTPLSFQVSQAGSTASINVIDKPEYSMNIYPNPNPGTFEISLQGLESGAINISLTSILGKEVWSLKTNTGYSEWTRKIQIDNLLKGVYFLSVETDLGMLRQVVVVR